MVDMKPIDIRIDEDAFREQVRESLQKEFELFAGRLRDAADRLDGGSFWSVQNKYLDAEYERGFKEGKNFTGEDK